MRTQENTERRLPGCCRYVSRLCWAGILLFLAWPSWSQNMTGNISGNYSGTQGLMINPSFPQNNKIWLDVHLAGAGLFLQNNFLYMRKDEYRFPGFFQPGYEWPTHEEDYGTEERIFYYYPDRRPKDVFINLRINGPGAMVAWKNHLFALTTALRSVVSIHNAPYELSKFAYLGLNYRPQHNINYIDNKPFSVGMMAWMEVGLTWSNQFHARGFNKWTAGVTVKRLMASAGADVRVRQADYVVPDDSTIIVNNLDGTMGLSLPVSYDDFSQGSEKIINGGGFGADLGITYTRLRKSYQTQYVSRLCAQRYDPYLYRIGVSLIDLGAVRFNKNARKMHINNRSSYWESVTRLDIRSIDHLLDTISYQFYGDTVSAFTGDKFTLWLPAALSLQADYHLYRNFYVNATLVHGLNLIGNGLKRPSELSITPRFETSWLEVNLPVSLYDWSLARIGLSVRVYGFTVGTDKLGGFFSLNDFTGLDFYFSVRFFLEKGKCGRGKVKGCLEREQGTRWSKF